METSTTGPHEGAIFLVLCIFADFDKAFEAKCLKLKQKRQQQKSRHQNQLEEQKKEFEQRKKEYENRLEKQEKDYENRLEEQKKEFEQRKKEYENRLEEQKRQSSDNRHILHNKGYANMFSPMANLDSPATFKSRFPYQTTPYQQWPEFQPLAAQPATLPDTFTMTFSDTTMEKTMYPHVRNVIEQICSASGDKYDVHLTCGYE